MVNDLYCNLQSDELKKSVNCFVKLYGIEKYVDSHVRLCGYKLKTRSNTKYKAGKVFHIDKGNTYSEIAINSKVLRVSLNQTTYVQSSCNEPALSLANVAEQLNTSRKGILKTRRSDCVNVKSVKFDEKVLITPVFHSNPSEHELSGYMFDLKDNDKMEDMEDMEVVNGAVTNESSEREESVLETPKRKRGRPKGSLNKKDVDPLFVPTMSLHPRKRGWETGIPRRLTPIGGEEIRRDPNEPKRKRGRPRKYFPNQKLAFDFQNIISDIKTIGLPSDLWSAHVSVGAKRSQVCFTRVVQVVANTRPVEFDRCVKFESSISYLIKVNNRDVSLLAAPKKVGNLHDIEVLLQIINDIDINDPVLEYHKR